jgi:hypothetical protein
VLPAVLQQLPANVARCVGARRGVLDRGGYEPTPILFMISTSMSKDIFKRYSNRSATDAELLGSARAAAVVGGASECACRSI